MKDIKDYSIWTELIDKLDDKEYYYNLKNELENFNKMNDTEYEIYHNGLELAISLKPEILTSDEYRKIKELTINCGFFDSYLYGNKNNNCLVLCAVKYFKNN